jgi:tRNA pseudouridine55 synthase
VIGFLVVDKDAGWTSHDVVARCRRLLGERRIGHAGTLDPGATGVLVLGVGSATRLLRYVSGADKDYTAEVVLGATTSTLDDEGEVTARFDMSGVTLEQARAAAAALTGDIAQQVPMVSAVKVGGQRLHRLARAGVSVETPVRRVRVDRFDVEPGSEPGTFAIAVTCSAGTYVRVLAADLGAALGGGAHLRRLRRTRAGRFGERDARPLGVIEAERAAGRDVLRPPADALGFDALDVSPEIVADVAHGRPVVRERLGTVAPGPVALVAGGRLLAVYEVAAGDDLARPAVVLSAAEGA